VSKEEHAIPSWEALQLHWKRSLWVLTYWQKANTGYITMPSKLLIFLFNIIIMTGLSEYGWKREDGKLQYIWDTDENMHEVTIKVKRLTKGCKCKKGSTGRCGCRQEGRECGPGCSCVNCTNCMSIGDEHETDDLVCQERQQIQCGSSDEDDNANDYIGDNDYDDDEKSIEQYYTELEAEVDQIMFDTLYIWGFL
jgi:hypothetical protein